MKKQGDHKFHCKPDLNNFKPFWINFFHNKNKNSITFSTKPKKSKISQQLFSNKLDFKTMRILLTLSIIQSLNLKLGLSPGLQVVCLAILKLFFLLSLALILRTQQLAQEMELSGYGIFILKLLLNKSSAMIGL